MLPRSFRGVWSVARSLNAHLSYILKKTLGGNPKLISSLRVAVRLQEQLLDLLTEEQTRDILPQISYFGMVNSFSVLIFFSYADKQDLFAFLSVITVPCESSDIEIATYRNKASISCTNLYLKSPARCISLREYAVSSVSLSTKVYSGCLNFVSSTKSHLLNLPVVQGMHREAENLSPLQFMPSIRWYLQLKALFSLWSL